MNCQILIIIKPYSSLALALAVSTKVSSKRLIMKRGKNKKKSGVFHLFSYLVITFGGDGGGG